MQRSQTQQPLNIIPMSYHLKDVGKNKQGLKMLHEWAVLIDGVKHIITMFRSLISGTVTVSLDGQIVIEIAVPTDGLEFSNTYPLEIGRHKLEIRHNTGDCELFFDGQSFAELYNKYGEGLEGGHLSLLSSVQQKSQKQMDEKHSPKQNQEEICYDTGVSYKSENIMKATGSQTVLECEMVPKSDVKVNSPVNPIFQQNQRQRQPYNNPITPSNVYPPQQNGAIMNNYTVIPNFQHGPPHFPPQPYLPYQQQPSQQNHQNRGYQPFPHPQQPYYRQNSPNRTLPANTHQMGQQSPNPHTPRQPLSRQNSPAGHQFFQKGPSYPMNQNWQPNPNNYSPNPPPKVPSIPTPSHIFNDPLAVNILASKAVQLLSNSIEKNKSPRQQQEAIQKKPPMLAQPVKIDYANTNGPTHQNHNQAKQNSGGQKSGEKDTNHQNNFKGPPSEPIYPPPPPSANLPNSPGNFKIPSYDNRPLTNQAPSKIPVPGATPLGQQTDLPASMLDSDIPSRIPMPTLNVIEPESWVQPDFLKSSGEINVKNSIAKVESHLF